MEEIVMVKAPGIDDPNAKQRHLRNAIECERALAIEKPLDPAKESSLEESQQNISTTEARIRHVQNELIQKSNAASISTGMKNLENGEEKFLLIPRRTQWSAAMEEIVTVKAPGIDDPNARQRHLRNAIDSARRAVELSPNSIELSYLYANSLYVAANDEKDYEEVVTECERALAIEKPVDPAKESSLEESQQKISTTEAADEQISTTEAADELRQLIQKSNIASISTWMKNLGNGEEKFRLIPRRRVTEDPREVRSVQSRDPREVRSVQIRENVGNVSVLAQWIFLLASLCLEIVSAVFEQVSSPRKPHFALIAMVLGILALLTCITELFLKAKKARVRLVGRRGAPLFYHPPPHNRLFGTFSDVFGLLGVFFQLAFSIVQYVYLRRHVNNPIKVCFWPFLLIFCVAGSILIGNRRNTEDNHETGEPSA